MEPSAPGKWNDESLPELFSQVITFPNDTTLESHPIFFRPTAGVDIDRCSNRECITSRTKDDSSDPVPPSPMYLEFDARKNLNIDVVVALLQYKPNLNFRGCRGDTALYKAVGLGNVELEDLLIGAGADLNLKHFGGHPALYHHHHFTKFELRRGFQMSINVISVRPPPPEDETISKKLLAAGADVNATGPNGRPWCHQKTLIRRFNCDMPTHCGSEGKYVSRT